MRILKFISYSFGNFANTIAQVRCDQRLSARRRDELRRLGTSRDSSPPCWRNLYLTVSHGTIPNLQALLEDLRECVEIVKRSTPIDSAAIRAMVAAALHSPDPGGAFGELAATAGLVGNELSSEMALINEVLDALPDELCNLLLVNYFNDLYM